MSKRGNDSPWTRRKSSLAHAFTPIDNALPPPPLPPPPQQQQHLQQRPTHRKSSSRKLPSLMTDLDRLDHPDLPHMSNELRSAPPLQEPPRYAVRRYSQTTPKAGSNLRPSLFGSFRHSSRTSVDAGPFANRSPVTAASPSRPWDAAADTLAMGHPVLHHGEVQTSAGLLRKRKEYLVLTDVALHRFKSQSKASEVFAGVKNPAHRHVHSPSFGSQSDLASMSESSGERDGRVPLRHIVAVKNLDDGKPYFAFELSHLDERGCNQAAAMTLQFANPEDRDLWLARIRGAAADVRMHESAAEYISRSNLENAARVVERERDYDPANCAIFKVAQRQTAKPTTVGRSSSDDLAKVASTVCFLAIGVHKVHIVQPVKALSRVSSSSPSLPPAPTSHATASYGILSLTSLVVSRDDDSIELTFRRPLQRPKTLYLASCASHEIAARLYYVEQLLRPERGPSMYHLRLPDEADNLLVQPAPPSVDDHCGLDRTLSAYCAAYGVNAANVRYSINYHCEDAPRFELLPPPADTRRDDYGPLELLAIMRALRYNESFGSLSFAGLCLDSLNGLHDNYGREHVCFHTKRGTPIKLSERELTSSCLLVQEIRALAACSKKLRRLDFSGCVTTTVELPNIVRDADEDATKPVNLGCGIVEALFPLCRYQTTNVDWICLNGIQLTDTDLDYLVGAAVDKSCHFRAIELNRCGLGDRSLGLVLDALRSQDNTLEAVEIAGNTARFNPVTFDGQLGMFGFIRRLDLSYVLRTSGPEPLLTAETLLIWRLQDLKLTGTTLNPATVNALATYLAHPQSLSLRELAIDQAYVSGSDIALLLRSMVHEPEHVRQMHLDISQDLLSKGFELFVQSIADGYAPTHLTMRAIEYKNESMFRKLLVALTANKTIQYLDMSQSALPGDAGDETCRALERLLAENDSLIALDLSGEDSRLATSRFGPGINDALAGLKRNRTLERFHVEKQKLGLQGASTLADVLKSNFTLRELYCAHNEIPLQGLTDLVNSLVDNTSLIYLPTMDDGRSAAFKAAEATMRGLAALPSPPPPSQQTKSSFAVKRGLSNARRSVLRAASTYTPSLSALPIAPKSNSIGDARQTASLTFTLPDPKNKRGSADSSSAAAATMSFTVQDMQNTHRLLTEQWDRQCHRLSQFLERNWCLLHEVPVDPHVTDEASERPGSAGSLGHVLAQVKYDTTPRAERPLYFDDDDSQTPSPDPPVDLLAADSTSCASDPEDTPPTPEDTIGIIMDEKRSATISFQRFVVGSGESSPDEEGEEGEEAQDYGNVRPTARETSRLAHRVKELRINTTLTELDGPPTPTQKAFTAV